MQEPNPMNDLSWPQAAVVREVGLRDGLQSIARILPTREDLAESAL